MKTTKFLTAAIIVSTSLSSYAAEIRQLPTIYAVHLNGIDTTKFEADTNLRKLKVVSQINFWHIYLCKL